MKLFSDLLAFLMPEPLAVPPLFDVPVPRLSADSRQVSNGELFLALKGLSADGVDYALQAKARGAWVVGHRPAEGVDWVVPHLAERLVELLKWFYDDPAEQLKLIGITGTNGKTTTSHYTAYLLTALAKKVAILGTVGNGIWGELSESTHTTPDVVSLYHQLAQWRDQDVEFVVMEVSSHAIAQDRIAGLRFAVVALTQVTRDHLDYHGDEATYREVKARFLRDTPSQQRVLNLDDALGATLAQTVDHVGYGFQRSAVDKDADVRIYKIVPDGQDTFVHIGTGIMSLECYPPVIGRFNAMNLICATACVRALGFELRDFSPAFCSRLQLPAVAGRMQRVSLSPLVIVDYAHTPDALEKVLQAVREHCPKGKLWVVFGAGGDRDVGKRPLMGQVAESYADHVIVTDDNPRSEDPTAIAETILSGMQSPDVVRYIADRASAIGYAVQSAMPEDVILIAGKGHETYQEVQGKRLPFSDVEVIRSCQR